jgi:hypothetical protein
MRPYFLSYQHSLVNRKLDVPEVSVQPTGHELARLRKLTRFVINRQSLGRK